MTADHVDTLATLLLEYCGPNIAEGGACEAAEWLCSKGVVVLPPDPTHEMIEAAFKAGEAYLKASHVGASPLGHINAQLGAALAVLRGDLK